MLQIFKNEIEVTYDSSLEELKKIIRSQLDKGKKIDWDDLPDYFKNSQNMSWYEDIIELRWLNKIIDDGFYEIIGHHPQHIIKISQHGQKIFSFPHEQDDWELMLEVIAHSRHEEWNYRKPFCSLPISLNSKKFRLSLSHHSLGKINCSKFFLRAHKLQHLNFESFNLNTHLQQKLHQIIQSGDHLLVAGGTGSGKTSFLNCCLQKMPQDEHPILIEDIPELHSPLTSTTYLSAQDTHERSLSSLMKYSMRMSPTRLIVGEIRGKEALAFLMLMNTGHRGVYSTLHASSAPDAIHRLAQLFCLYSDLPSIRYDQVLRLICKNLKYIVFLEDKKVCSLIQILGIEGEQPFFNELIAF
jgi:type IV secretion system protein VirB11